MIDSDRWYLLMGIAVAALLLLIITFGGRWYRERRRRKQREQREKAEAALMAVDLDALTNEGYAAMKKTAERYGLDIKYIQRRQRIEADREAERKAMGTRQQEKLLEQIKADRVRQREREEEAIRSILEEVPEPRHDS